jgi:hypothetical protein
MSDNYIVLVPQQPEYVPPREAQKKALALMKELAPNEEVQAQISKEIRFIDCGENFERVLCPECSAEIPHDWWSEQMGEEFENGVPLRKRVLPCCRSQTTLAELKYEWPQAFGRFSLSVMNPQIGTLSKETVAKFEEVLGCPLQTIYQHY